MFERWPDAAWVFDPAGTLIRANARARAIADGDPRERLDPPQRELLLDALRSPSVQQHLGSWPSKPGGPTYSWRVAPLGDEAVLIAQDVQAVEDLAPFTATLAHQLNNHFMVISANCSLMPMVDTEAQRAELIEEIAGASEDATALTRNIGCLSVHRPPPSSPQCISLAELVSELSGVARKVAAPAALTVDMPKNLALVHFDDELLRYTLVRIFACLCQPMPPTGLLRVSARDGPTVDGVDFVLLTFEATATRLERGALEPSIRALRAESAQLRVERSEELTTVTLHLPRASYIDPPGAEPARPRGCRPTGQTVLLVEDDTLIRKITRRALELAGYRVFMARSPGEALLLVESVAEGIDVVFTDIVMPHLSGVELMQRIGDSGHRYPTLYTSGFSRSVVESHGLPPDAAFIGKPYDLNALPGLLDAVVEASRAC